MPRWTGQRLEGDLIQTASHENAKGYYIARDFDCLAHALLHYSGKISLCAARFLYLFLVCTKG
jgi:hypothetical protein